jgi:hypothetical protein
MKVNNLKLSSLDFMYYSNVPVVSSAAGKRKSYGKCPQRETVPPLGRDFALPIYYHRSSLCKLDGKYVLDAEKERK